MAPADEWRLKGIKIEGTSRDLGALGQSREIWVEDMPCP